MGAFSISTSVNRKNIVNLLFFIVFAWILLAATDFHSYYDRAIRNVTYTFLAGVALFFIQSIVLIPIKLEENNTRKFLWFSLVSIIAFTFIEGFIFFDINRRSYPDRNIFGIVPDQLFSLDSLIIFTAAICILFLILGILLVIYSLIVYGFRVISPYLEVFVHIIVLMMLFALLVTVPDKKSNDVIMILPLTMVFYINTFLVTPILFRGKKTKNYLLVLLTLVLGYFLFQTILQAILGLPRFNLVTGYYYTRNTPLILVLIFTLFLSFVYSYVRIKTKAKEKFFNIKLGAKESELKLLKSQVNPHFLFNTLNTLYATALTENAEKTGESIAKLASLLRYMQKDINKDFIPLENEVNYLQDYIAIQKLRCAVEPQVETEFTAIENQLISPGLLIPFVENAFKYGIDPSKLSKLSVSVICSNDKIYFSCVNSCNDEFKTFHKEQSLGIGIKNAKQRLELVYPKYHTFEIINSNNEFSVKITIAVHTKD